MAKTGKNSTGKISGELDARKLVKHEKKLAKQRKRELRAEADKARFQNSDRKSISAIVGNREAGVTHTQALSPNNSSPDVYRSTTRNKTGNSLVQQNLSANASFVLSLALGALLLMAFLAGADINGGKAVIHAFGGNFLVPPQGIPEEIFRVTILLDTVFPMMLGAGFAILLTSVQSRGNRPLVRMALSAILVGVLADFAENAVVFSALQGNPVSPFQIVFSVVKFAAFAFAGVIGSALIPVYGFFGKATHLLLRYVFPVAASLSIAKVNTGELFGFTDEMLSGAIGICFIVTILTLAIYAMNLSEPDHD